MMSWSPGRVIPKEGSDVFRPVQMTDICTSCMDRLLFSEQYVGSRFNDAISRMMLRIENEESVRREENREGPQHIPALLPEDDTDCRYLTDSERPSKKSGNRKKSPTVSKNKKNNRTENRDIPQYRPALLQYERTNPNYLKDSKPNRNGKGLGGNTQLPPSAPIDTQSGTGYKRFSAKGSIGSRRRCAPWS